MFDDETIKRHEDVLLRTRLKGRAVHINQTIAMTHGDVRVDLHALHMKGEKEAAPVLFLIHGTAASSMSFVETMDALSSSFDVYVVDLPGFGRSHVNKTFEEIAELYEEDSADFHSDALVECMNALNIQRAYLCGHSFGGYVCTRFGKRHPERVLGLILIGPAGIFPTMGGLGMYWGCFFVTSLPNLGRRLGRLGYAITQSLTESSDVLYWYCVLAHPRGMGDSFVRDKITFDSFSAYWNEPSLAHFEEFPFRVCLIYGERDTIMPPHQGMVLHRIHGYTCNVIPNAGHSPMNDPQGAAAVSNAILDFFRARPTTPTQVGKSSNPYAIQASAYKGSFHVPTMYGIIARLYEDVGKRYGVSVDGIDAETIEHTKT